MSEIFHRAARRTAALVGSPQTFVSCILFTVLWLCGGLIWGFSSVYQLYYNTAVSAITWLLVVLLQGSQNAQEAALHKKLDELLRAHHEARTDLVDLEHRPQREVDEREAEFARVHDEES